MTYPGRGGSHPSGSASHPLVSVIVPAYGHERYISEALDSIVEDGYPNLEVVAIDDGSPDKTWDLIDAWRMAHAGRVGIIALRQENMGLTRTLNRLLELANGQYVALLTSDDRLRPDGIAHRVGFLGSNPRIAAVFGDCRVIDANGAVIAQRGVGFGDPRRRVGLLRDPAREIVSHWGVQGSVILFRRDAIRSMGGYSEDLMIEDWDLYLRLASEGRIAYVDRIVADYRWHGSNTVDSAERAPDIANEMRHVAWRSRNLFHGHLRVELMHESAAWAARSAGLRRRWAAWAVWKSVSIALKLLAMAVPYRASGQRAGTE